MTNLRFEQPLALLLLWLLPLLWYGWRHIRSRHAAAVQRFVSPAMQTVLLPSRPQRKHDLQAAAALLALVCAILALARPQWGLREERVVQQGRDVIILLDVSRSMLANDVHPDRLRRAKADLHDLIDGIQGDRAGLMVFRRSAVMVCPLTTDYAFLKHMLNMVEPDFAPAGSTDIGRVIYEAIDAFDEHTGNHRAMLLISDGEDLGGMALEAAQAAADNGIRIFTIGIGSREGSRIPDPDSPLGFVTFRGEPVITRLEHETLHSIAQITGGAYIPVETAGFGATGLGRLYREHLAPVEQRSFEESLRQRHIERYQWFLGMAVILLFSTLLLSPGRPGGKRRQSPHSAKAVTAVLLIAALTGQLEAAQAGTSIPPGRAGAAIARELYRKGEYAEAAEAYLAARRGAAGIMRNRFTFNAAMALYRAGEYRAAAELFRGIPPESTAGAVRDSAKAAGAAYYSAAAAVSDDAADRLAERAELLRLAAEAFKQAVRHSPADQETAENLAVAFNQWQTAEETARRAAVLEKYGDKDLTGLLDLMRRDQTALVEEITAALPGGTPQFIRTMENLAAEQRMNNNRWYALEPRLDEALADLRETPDGKMLDEHIGNTRRDMQRTADMLEDLHEDAVRFARISRHNIYQLWKGVAPFSALLEENLNVQSNLVDRTRGTREIPPERPESLVVDQHEARSLTDYFIARFTNAVPEGVDEGPIDSATREQIIGLTEHAAIAQEEALQALREKEPEEALPAQIAARDILQQIYDLLPKQESQADPEQQPEERPEEQSDDDEEQQPAPGEDEQPEAGEEEEQPAPEDEPEAPDEDEDAEAEPAEPQDEDGDEQQPPMPEHEIQRLLQQILEREDEYQRERRRRQHLPLSPDEKDW